MPDLEHKEEPWAQELCSTDLSIRNARIASLQTLLRQALTKGFGRKLSSDWVEDMVQESSLKILNKIETYSGKSRFSSWAISIAVNHTLSQLRRKSFQNLSLDELGQEVGQKLMPGPDAPLQERQTFELLHHAIHSVLTERQRKALLAKLGGAPMSEIARQSGRPQGAIYKLLHDSRKSLRAHFETQGIGLSELLGGM